MDYPLKVNISFGVSGCFIVPLLANSGSVVVHFISAVTIEFPVELTDFKTYLGYSLDFQKSF